MKLISRVVDVLFRRRGEREEKAERLGQLTLDVERVKRDAKTVLERRRLDGYADVRVPR